MKKLILITLFIFITLPVLANAQIIESVSEDLVITSNPKFPRPGDIVLFEVKSFAYDLNNSKITWFLNDSLVKEGLSATSFTAEAGKIGSRMKITIIATPTVGIPVSETFTLYPNEVELTWQASSYTPPFYRGKALPASGAQLQFIASPTIANTFGTLVKDENLNYTWRDGTTILGSLSGRGKNILNIEGPVLREPLTISVEVETQDGLVRGKKTQRLVSSDPEILFYKNDPLLGQLFHRAIKNSFTLGDDETQFTAYPYYFDVSDRNDSDLEFKWTLQKKAIEDLGEDRGSLVLGRNNGAKGSAKIELTIQNLRSIFQFAENTFNIEF